MTTDGTMEPEALGLREDEMVSKERWTEIRGLAEAGETISALARRFDLDRKTVRAGLQKTTWEPYRRAARDERLLRTHEDSLRERASVVQYSAQILFQAPAATRLHRELRDRASVCAATPRGGLSRRPDMDTVRDRRRSSESD